MSGRSSWAPPVSGSHHHLPAGMPDHSAVDRPRHQQGGTTGRRVRIAGGKSQTRQRLSSARSSSNFGTAADPPAKSIMEDRPPPTRSGTSPLSRAMPFNIRLRSWRRSRPMTDARSGRYQSAPCSLAPTYGRNTTPPRVRPDSPARSAPPQSLIRESSHQRKSSSPGPKSLLRPRETSAPHSNTCGHFEGLA